MTDLPIVFKRQTKQYVFIALNVAALSYVAYVFISEGLSDGTTWKLLCGGVAVVWGGWMLYALGKMPNLGELTAQGITLRRPLGVTSITWDEMIWAKISPERRFGIIGYRTATADHDAFVGVSYKLIAQKDVAAIRSAIQTHRPDLPDAPTIQEATP